MKKSLAFLIVLGTLNSCCNEDFEVPYDFSNNFRSGAIDVTQYIQTGGSVDCVANLVSGFSTMAATGDGAPGSCWDESDPIHNVWFKFVAPATTDISINIYVGGTEGTQRKTFAALWDTDGTTELACANYIIFGVDDADLYMYEGALTPGATYYLSVDVADSESVGTFSLCLYDTD